MDFKCLVTNAHSQILVDDEYERSLPAFLQRDTIERHRKYMHSIKVERKRRIEIKLAVKYWTTVSKTGRTDVLVSLININRQLYKHESMFVNRPPKIQQISTHVKTETVVQKVVHEKKQRASREIGVVWEIIPEKQEEEKELKRTRFQQKTYKLEKEQLEKDKLEKEQLEKDKMEKEQLEKEQFKTPLLRRTRFQQRMVIHRCDNKRIKDKKITS